MSRKYIDIKQFREAGYLQELNRVFLHSLGLALVVTDNEDGSERLFGILDFRDDPEGIFFAAGTIDPKKAANIADIQNRRNHDRHKALGFVVQPVPQETT